MKILFFAKAGHWATEQCLEKLKQTGADFVLFKGARNDPFPEINSIEGIDYVMSFSSQWIIPESVLSLARYASLNFHPGSPEYPGIGCTNFALYERETAFGVTCHHMHSKVDTGPIVKVNRFDIYENDSVQSLTDRCYYHMVILFAEILDQIISGKELTGAAEHWARKPFTRHELNELGRISLNMSADEVQRRVHAMAFPGYPGAFIEFQGVRFEAIQS
tara:strand:- start:8494 stop:9150 length:657 start_codon:yes stop_codon:yes gene_type:complete